MSAIVYLLHFVPPTPRSHRHYLGVAASEDAIPPTIRHGHGSRAAPAHVVADVWDCHDQAEADRTYKQLQGRGSRQRLCSVCTPGNGAGNGRGNYARKGAKGADL